MGLNYSKLQRISAHYHTQFPAQLADEVWQPCRPSSLSLSSIRHYSKMTSFAVHLSMLAGQRERGRGGRYCMLYVQYTIHNIQHASIPE